MAKLPIQIGSSPNDGSGDSLRDGAIKINSNFSEIYSVIGDGNNLTNSIAFASTSGFSTNSGYASTAGIATFAVVSGLTTYAPISGISSVSNYALVSGIATNATYADTLINSPDITVGIITASKYIGSGSSLSGIITSLVAGNNITIDQYAGIATINSTGGGGAGTSSQWLTTLSGIVTTSRVGIGTNITDTSSYLNVHGGGINVTGLTAGGSGLKLQDGVKINFGSDASVYYDAVDLRLDTSSSIRMGDGTRDIFTARSGEGSQLYYDGSRKLSTLSTGVLLEGNLSITGDTSTNSVVAVSSVTASEFYGNGSSITGIVTNLVAGFNVSISTSFGEVTIDVNSDSIWTENATGISTLRNVGLGTTTATHKLTVLGDSNFDGAVGFTSDIELSTGRIGVPASGNIKIGSEDIGSGGVRNIGFGDRALNSLSGGNGHNIAIGDLSLQSTSTGQYNIAVGDRSGREVTTGNYNVIIGGFDGNNPDLDIRTSSNNVVLSDGEGNIKLFIGSNGNVAIKTTFTNEALNVSGIVSATGFYGQLNAEQLTGTLPAIDGSNLLNVTAVGSGVEIRDNSLVVGTASTIDFGSNLEVSFGSGIATVGVTSVSNATTAYSLSGTPNLNVGVATATAYHVGQTKLTDGYLNLSGNIYWGNIFLSGRDLKFVGEWDGGSNYGDYIFYKRSSFGGLTEVARIDGSTGGADFAGTTKLAGISSFTSSGITFNTNLNTSGIITASSFSGSYDASQLTGSLPAIDGSNLLNVTASGTGVSIESNGFPVGSATTINLGTGLGVDFSAGVATVTASGGSGSSRVIVSGSTASIADESIGNIDIIGYKTYALMQVGLSTTGWIRLYTDSTSRANDINRGLGTDPLPGSGVIAEVVTSGISTQQIVSPFAIGGNLNNPVDTTIYASIKNLSGSTQIITANLTILPLEV